MSRPIESDYTSQIAYTRALEAYCDSLAQQEPVAIALNTGTKQGVKWLKNVEHGEHLYTSPPAQRKPLTDEQVTDGCRSLGVGAYRTLAAAFEAGVRFAEAAHGIKENT